LRILGDQNRVIENFIRDSDTVVSELADHRGEVSRWVREAGNTAQISATRSAEIRQGFRRLPTFLAELRPTMARLEDLIDAQTPLLGDLRHAAPSLTTFFERLGPFSQASRPALRGLGAASRAGTKAFREGAQEITELGRLAPKTKPTFKPLRQWLQSMDDRRRAIEPDPRAKASAPPPPDPTAIGRDGGFTGLEAPWNYFFWQTLSLNGVGDFGHYLRLGVTINDCSPVRNSPPRTEADRQLFRKCNQWLGPNQPGVTTPDFTLNGPRMRQLRRDAARPPARVGERRHAGQPEAAPLPGQRDISKPQVVLPPDVRRLIDKLAPKGRARLPVPSAPAPGSDEQLLDFLLGS
jgi:hypothetical protein